MAGALCACAWSGCSSAVPAPSYVQVRADDYVAVPFMPRPPPVEIVPPRPKVPGDLVWADGGWEWANERYRWEPGAWVAPAPGAKRARWVIVRREVDGQLFLAPSTWRNESGRLIDPPTPLARAVTRLGEEPATSAAPAAGGGGAGAGTDGGAAPSGPAIRTDLDD